MPDAPPPPPTSSASTSPPPRPPAPKHPARRLGETVGTWFRAVTGRSTPAPRTRTLSREVSERREGSVVLRETVIREIEYREE